MHTFYLTPTRHTPDPPLAVARLLIPHAPSPAACSTWHDNDQSYATLSGTSMACPLVAGMAAVMFAAKPGVSYQEVK